MCSCISFGYFYLSTALLGHFKWFSQILCSSSCLLIKMWCGISFRKTVSPWVLSVGWWHGVDTGVAINRSFSGSIPGPVISSHMCPHHKAVNLILANEQWCPAGGKVIIISRTIFIVLSSWLQGHCESSLSSFDECRTAPSGRRPLDHTTDLGCESACRLLSSTTTIAIYYYYSTRELIIIYCPTEGRRLSWPRHCRKGVHSPCPRL